MQDQPANPTTRFNMKLKVFTLAWPYNKQGSGEPTHETGLLARA